MKTKEINGQQRSLTLDDRFPTLNNLIKDLPKYINEVYEEEDFIRKILREIKHPLARYSKYQSNYSKNLTILLEDNHLITIYPISFIDEEAIDEGTYHTKPTRPQTITIREARTSS